MAYLVPALQSAMKLQPDCDDVDPGQTEHGTDISNARQQGYSAALSSSERAQKLMLELKPQGHECDELRLCLTVLQTCQNHSCMLQCQLQSLIRYRLQM